MSIEQRDLCESTCKTLWRSVCKTLEQRELCESTFKTFWRSVCKTWEHRACNIGETKYLQQDKREVDMNACYRKRTYRRYCPPNQPRAKTRERSTWMLAKQDQIWATPPPHKLFLSTSWYYKAFTQRGFTQRSFYTEELLHTEIFIFTQRIEALHTEAVTHRSFYAQTLLHPNEFTQHRKAACLFYKRNFYTEQAFTQTFTQTSFYTDRFYSKQVFTQRSFYTEQAFTYATATEIAAPKPDLGTKAKKGRFWNTSLNEF